MLARLVQQFRERIKAKVNTISQFATTANQSHVNDSAKFKSYAQEHKMEAHTQQNKVSKRGLVYGRKLGSAEYCNHGLSYRIFSDFQTPSLLLDLDRQAGPGALPLSNVAAHDQLFLDYESQGLACFKEIERAGHVLDITTLILDRLQAAHEDQSLRQQASAAYPHMDDIDYEKYIANLEHVLRTIQHVAFDALIQRSVEALESDCHHWDQYLEQQRRLHGGWFTEWPSGRRPLSTTMPWNIKPSLMVLWGVCWMFYTPPPDNRQSQGEAWISQGAWAPSLFDQGYSKAHELETFDLLTEEFFTDQVLGYVETSSEDSNQNSIHAYIGPSQPNIQASLGRTGGPMSSGGMIGPVLANAPYSPVMARAVTTQSMSQSHVTVRSPASPGPFVGLQKRVGIGHGSRRGGPAQRVGSPYIRAALPSVAATTAPSEGQFATDISTWTPHNQGTNPGFAVAPTHHEWQQPNSAHTNISSPSSQSLYSHSSATVNPYVASYATPASGPSNSYYPAYPSPGTIGGPYSHLGLQIPMQGSQNYPSPHSAASERASSLCPVTMSADTSPQLQREPSPSIPYSPPRRRDTSKAMNEEPPLNSQGQIYCNHADCEGKSETFARKCEWKKHRDKHLRPYICHRPECEKIPGFTYSGGLLRHEREVHREHGGPKAPRLCPHPDCKRSTGIGFSRKENLNEHLRRVHRGVGILKDDNIHADGVPVLPPMLSSDDPGSSRKRRRDQEEEEHDDDPDLESNGASRSELLAEIKRLKQELAQKDDRLKHMESLMTSALSNQQNGSRYKME